MLHLQPLLWLIYVRHVGGLDEAGIRDDKAALVELPHVDGVDHRMLVTSRVHLGQGPPPRAGNVLCNESMEDALKVKNAIADLKNPSVAQVGCNSSDFGPADIREARQPNPDGSGPGRVASLLGMRLFSTFGSQDTTALIIVFSALGLIALVAVLRWYYTSSGGYTSSPHEYRGRHEHGDSDRSPRR